MKIGFDFDNTIVCYDQAFEKLSETLDLPKELNRSKLSIRDYLRSQNRENEWTEFQGIIYGPGMIHAKIFKNFPEVCNKLSYDKHELFIVSHRSKYPYLGEQYDLHLYAKEWLKNNFNQKNFIKIENIYFLETLNEKLNKIRELNLDIFVDDLPEVINHSLFPDRTKAILFNPNRIANDSINILFDWEYFYNHV